MNLSNINSNSLRNLVKLIKRKDSLAKEIEKIDSQLSSLLGGKSLPSGKRPGRPAGKKASKATPSKKKKRAPRGALKKKIFAALRTAGNAGLKVPDLSKKVGAKNVNVHVWLSTTGKKLPEIKKLGKGHYKLQEKTSTRAS